MAIVSCPQCGVDVEWTPANRFRPFCSERCKQIDLGAWAAGDYAIPVTDALDPNAQPEDPSGG